MTFYVFLPYFVRFLDYVAGYCIVQSRQFEPCACQRPSRRRPQLTRLSNKRLSSRHRLQAAAKRGPPVEPVASDRLGRPRYDASTPRSRRRGLQAVWDGTFATSTPPTASRKRGGRSRAGRAKLRKYSKQLKAARNDPSLPANGQLRHVHYKFPVSACKNALCTITINSLTPTVAIWAQL